MNQTEYKELEKYLPGLTPDLPDAYWKLAEIIKHQVFELHSHTEENGKQNCFIPYMMNDALECYLILKECRITGTYLTGFEGKTEAYLTENNGSHALIVRQGEENVFTLWFEELQEELRCYQYHQIGHFWVKGQEQWRQLVYIIGTIYDKFEYLGEAVCTEEEIELLPLMEFAPFRAWSPIHESLDDHYPDTLDGVNYIKSLVLETGDKTFAVLLDLYRKMPVFWLEKWIERRLLSSKSAELYQLIYEKVKRASKSYPKRDYGKEMNEEIRRQRSNVTQTLHQKGFQGSYPFFRRNNMQILAAEEHPFTILEAEDFNFRIQFMVSESKGVSGIRNLGFFKGRKNKGRIEKDLKNVI